MNEINWGSIDHNDFERVVLHLVRALGFEEATLRSGTADRGEDVTAYPPSRLPQIRMSRRKWVFQAKHAKAITRRAILDELAHFATRRIDTWVLVTTFSPSSEMRRWLASLGRTPKHSFAIEAWWKDDLDHLVRQNSTELVSSLPSDISQRLGLSAVGHRDSTQEFNQLCARLRNTLNDQIDRFARSKYLPKLYVTRQVETEISTFVSDESIAASRCKRLGRDLLARVADTVQSLDGTAPLPARSTAQRIVDLASTPLRRRPRPSAIDSQARGTALDWIKCLRKAIDATSEILSTIADDRYFDTQSVFDSLAVGLAQLSAIAKSAPEKQLPSLITVRHDREDSTSLDLRRGAVKQHLTAIGTHIDSLLALNRSMQRPGLLVIDRAGGGKTNLLCHTALRLVSEQPVILLFGKEPLEDTRSLIERLESDIAAAIDATPDTAMTRLDHLLQKRGQFLAILIDGINENRQLARIDASLDGLFRWASHHRIKIVITCRDIYFAFFDSRLWERYIAATFRDQLRDFAADEFEHALPLYLDHFGIECTLDGAARAACTHPLLLRFFCESFGSTTGSRTTLGVVKDMRLKDLFDTYLDRKTDQIRRSLNHRDSAVVMDYLLNLVAFMLRSRTSRGLSPDDVASATGHRDLSSSDSLYIRILDEDIIFEEEPDESIDTRRISFVYEEFMEYLVARSMLERPGMYGVAGLGEVFALLDEASATWVNARGVAEYVALMALAGDFGTEWSEALRFIGLLAAGAVNWGEVVVGVLSKHPGPEPPDLLDVLMPLIGRRSGATESIIEARLARGDPRAERLTLALFCELLLPKVVSWAAAEGILRGDVATISRIEAELRKYLSGSDKAVCPDSLRNSAWAMRLAWLRLGSRVRNVAATYLRESAWDSYNPGLNSAELGRAIADVLRRCGPSAEIQLLNGLLLEWPSAREHCARALGRVAKTSPQIASMLYRLAEACEDKALGRQMRRAARKGQFALSTDI